LIYSTLQRSSTETWKNGKRNLDTVPSEQDITNKLGQTLKKLVYTKLPSIITLFEHQLNLKQDYRHWYMVFADEVNFNRNMSGEDNIDEERDTCIEVTPTAEKTPNTKNTQLD
jgi:hypothetical protein